MEQENESELSFIIRNLNLTKIKIGQVQCEKKRNLERETSVPAILRNTGLPQINYGYHENHQKFNNIKLPSTNIAEMFGIKRELNSEREDKEECKSEKLFPSINLKINKEGSEHPFRNSKSNSNGMLLYNENAMRYLKFRPVIDSATSKIKTPLDLGYYYRISCTESALIKNTLDDNGFRDILHPFNKFKGKTQKETNPNSLVLIFWTGMPLKGNQYKTLTPFQKVNHFPRSGEITRKDYLYRNIQRLAELHSQKDFNFMPKSFILPGETKFLEDEMNKDPTSIWIVKPVSSSQGRGIYFINKITELTSKSQQIACRYIRNPFLINGYKFDLRIYFLVTSLEPLRIYMYKEGLARFATEKYDLSNPFPCSKFMHLTNYAINKENENFIQNDGIHTDGEGSKWSYTALKEQLESMVNPIFNCVIREWTFVRLRTEFEILQQRPLLQENIL